MHAGVLTAPAATHAAPAGLPASLEQAQPPLLPITAIVPSLAAAETQGKSLVEAIIARDSDAKAAAAEARKQKTAVQRAAALEAKQLERAAAAAEKAAAKMAVVLPAEKAAAKIAVVLPAKKAAAKKAGAKPSAQVAVAAAAGKAVALPVGVAKPTFSNEASREQYLCRTGLKGPGQPTSFKDGNEGSMTQEAALAAATKWKAERIASAGA